MSGARFRGKCASDSPTKRWQNRFALVYLIVAIVFAACFAAFALNPINYKVVERQSSNLTSTAQAEANALEYVDDAQEFAVKAAEGSDLRITLIAQDGTVIADSEVDPATLENHLGREEVDDALKGENGEAQRLSSTDDTSRLYVAVPATYQGERTALRISEPIHRYHDSSRCNTQHRPHHMRIRNYRLCRHRPIHLSRIKGTLKEIRPS